MVALTSKAPAPSRSTTRSTSNVNLNENRHQPLILRKVARRLKAGTQTPALRRQVAPAQAGWRARGPRFILIAMARLLALSAVLLAASSAASPASAGVGHRRGGAQAAPAAGAGALVAADEVDRDDASLDDASDVPLHAGLPPAAGLAPAAPRALEGVATIPAVRVSAPRLRPLLLAPKTSPPPALRRHSP